MGFIGRTDFLFQKHANLQLFLFPHYIEKIGILDFNNVFVSFAILHHYKMCLCAHEQDVVEDLLEVLLKDFEAFKVVRLFFEIRVRV